MNSPSGMGDPDFVVGEVYYFVTYPEVRMMYPQIETYVFLGRNLSQEDLEETWYFQSVSDYAVHGSAVRVGGRPVFCAARQDLVEFRTQPELMEVLTEALRRRAGQQGI